MAYKDIKTIASDLRVTRNDIGSFLSVDDSCNLVWTNSRVTSTGGIWQYNIVEEDCYIILPSARLNVGLCVAIMRGKTSRTRNEQSGIYSSKANPKVVIFPYNNNSSGIGGADYDYIQGGPNFYCSDGIKWDTTSNSYVTNDLEWDEYSSIMFKSVYAGKNSSGTDKYSWVIINGVGSWDAEELVDSDAPLTEIKKLYSQFAVIAQTSSVNSLSASTETTDTEFLALDSIAPDGLPVTTKNEITSDTQYLVPQCATKSGGSYVKSNSYVIGRFTDSYNGTPHPVLYTEFADAGVNIFGPKLYWTPAEPTISGVKQPAVNTMKVEQIDNSINWLGYIYDDRTGTDVWWQDIKKKSFSKRMGLRQKGTITEPEGQNAQITKYLGAVQVIVPIIFSKIKTVNQTSSTVSSIRSIHAMIQSFFEISGNYTMPYTNVFKVPGTCFGADEEGVLDSDIITLTSSGLGETNTDSGYGSILEIPITDKDRENGSVNLVFEFIYKTPSISSSQQQYDEANFKTLNNDSNQYVLLNFIGIQSLKPTSISPEVEFEGFSLSKLGHRGSFTDGHADKIQKAYLDYTATTAESTTGYAGKMVSNGSYDYISAIEGGADYRSFFGTSTRYYPADNITKTILEYDTGFDIATETDTKAMKARLVIDWANRNYQFNGNIRINGEEYVGTLNKSFDEEAADIDFWRNGVVGISLLEAIHIQYNGMVRLPWLSDYKGLDSSAMFDARVNISNYKTVVHASGSVEVLMDYRCGWERAENEWTKKVYLDGSEYDGLIEDYSTQLAETQSPSKECIVPSHAMQLNDNPIAFSNSGSTDDENTAKLALLPYFKYDKEQEKTLHYFSTNWKNYGLDQADPLNPPKTQVPAVVANPFCELVFLPTYSGMLVCNVELPIQSGLSSTGYMIVKEVSTDETAGAYGDYTLVKDSGASINSVSNPGYTKTKIAFTDNVVANKRIRYTIIIYDAPWTEASISNRNASVNLPSNSAIVRYRPAEQALNITADGINDFKSLFDNNDYKGPDVQTDLSMNTVFNYQTPDITRLDIDKTNFNVENFSQMMFNTSASTTVSSTTTKNHGSCFSFHAYVLKEGV